MINISREYGRLLHINTTTTLDADGNIIYTKDEDFEFEATKRFDLNELVTEDNKLLSAHIISSKANTPYPENMDIIDAYSDSEKIFNEQQNSGDQK